MPSASKRSASKRSASKRSASERSASKRSASERPASKRYGPAVSHLPSSVLDVPADSFEHGGVRFSVLGNGGIDAQVQADFSAGSKFRVTPSQFQYGAGTIEARNFTVSFSRAMVAGGASMTVDLVSADGGTAMLKPRNGTYVFLRIPKGKSYIIDDDAFVGCSVDVDISVKRMKGARMFMGTGLYEAKLTAKKRDGVALIHTVERLRTFELDVDARPTNQMILNAKELLYYDADLNVATKSIARSLSARFMTGMFYMYVKGGKGKLAIRERDDETTVLNRIDTNVALVQAMWPCRQN